jgi:hypothetical protein
MEQRLVFSYFYYWYEPDNDDPRIVEQNAGLTAHFPAHRPADWRSAGWYRQQLLDQHQAGVDVALTVYWGNELYPETTWSTEGLRPMVQALDQLDTEQRPHPKIGLFFDSYVLQGTNLTEPAKIQWLADQIRAYFTRLPARHRATIDGRPIIWLYLSNFANDFNQATFDELSNQLEPDLGARPFWVAEESWLHTTWTDGSGQRHDDPRQPVAFDAMYRWGAAGQGIQLVEHPLPLASVGPGYDDSKQFDRGEDRSVHLRESGCYYARSWRLAQALGARWVVIETWNEFYEGSGVAETAEWGRDYIDASASYTAAFKAGRAITLPDGCSEFDE